MDVRPVLMCEHCVYQRGRIGTMYSWDELIIHVRRNHWNQITTQMGQPVYACSGCSNPVQMSYEPVVDFMANLFCGAWCLKNSYADRMTTHDTLVVLSQEMKDEEYVKQSLGVKQ